MTTENAHGWHSRPVLFVADLDRALRFYVGTLGFWKEWHENDGAGSVCQVRFGDCEIILCRDAERRDKSRFFVELTAGDLAKLRRLLAEKSVPSKQTWWGYDSIQINDPDGHEWLFPIEGNRPASNIQEVAT